MRQRGFTPIFILLIVAVIVGFVYFASTWTPDCAYQPEIENRSPKPVETNYSELIFLNDQDKQQIYNEIDSAENAKDLDLKLYTSIAKVVDSYEARGQSRSSLVIVPDFLSDKPRRIVVTSGGCKVDFLDNIELSPIKKDDMPLLKSFAKIFVDEISKYPLAWWEEALPPFVVFVKAARVDGEIVGGAEQGAIVYNITISSSEEYARRTVHHEIMHYLEHSSWTRNDSAWPVSSDVYFNEYRPNTAYINAEYPEKGFVTNYAKTNSLEDKAEIYSYLFISDRLKKINGWQSRDAVLKSKVDYLKEFIRIRVDKMDNSYFEKFIL